MGLDYELSVPVIFTFMEGLLPWKKLIASSTGGGSDYSALFKNQTSQTLGRVHFYLSLRKN